MEVNYVFNKITSSRTNTATLLKFDVSKAAQGIGQTGKLLQKGPGVTIHEDTTVSRTNSMIHSLSFAMSRSEII